MSPRCKPGHHVAVPPPLLCCVIQTSECLVCLGLCTGVRKPHVLLFCILRMYVAEHGGLQRLCTDGHLCVPTMQPYAVLLAQGASYVNFNLLVGSTEADMLPWMVYLEGAPCNVTRLAQ